MPVFVCGPRDRGVKNYILTVSKAGDWKKGLSPFFLGPVPLYGGYVARNVENGWQYSKVYPQFASESGDPRPDYFVWAEGGWENPRAIRYPMGKGAKPLYSWWDGEKLSYIEARKRIYIPLYYKAVRGTEAFRRLKEMYDAGEELWLWDYDGYNHKALGMTYKEVINCESRKMGHAFVLAMMLEGFD
jgi:hypothetical protein